MGIETDLRNDYLIGDYSKTQFLRINRDIKTNEEYNVLTIKRELAQNR
jgi:hypothetical protein